MSLSFNNVSVFAYKTNGECMAVTDLISTIKYSCGLDKVSQQLDITMAYGIYSTSLASLFFDTGQKIEVYIGSTLYFRGKVETTTLSIDKETISITCFDYLRNITKSKVCYNFSGISAYDAVCTIFKDLDIPYNEDGIFDGKGGSDSSIMINHLIKNKSAYDACMMIATELHRTHGVYYYMFMDTNGKINLKACDKYWAKQTIQVCSTPNQKNADGNLSSMTYKKDASDLITKVAVFDSKGNPVDISSGVSNTSTDDNQSGGDESDTGGE